MARAGAVVAEALALLGEHARPGATTEELDELAEEFIRSQGGLPTFKGYRGFPGSICTSPNSMVVHGIPGPYRLAEGDVVSIDVGVTLDGFVADSAYTFAAGFSVVRTLVGHGVGRSMHEEPQIPNFGDPGRGPRLAAGMTLAIEPMINAGAPGVYLEDDRWSVSTDDGSLSAHFEHTVAVTADEGPRILTQAPVGSLLR
jgi:methionyl aminopeptidase